MTPEPQIPRVKEVLSFSAEGQARVFVELLLGADANKVMADIKSSIDRIQSFPQDAEEPIVSLAANRKEVLSLIVYGDYAEKPLRALAEKVRDDLLDRDGILETSMQARFLIPMVISLGFGVLVATGILLLVVPAFYFIVEDARRLLGSALRGVTGDDPSREAATAPGE